MVRLPTELIDHVVSQLDSRTDILAFALTCRAFKCIAIPSHLEYRILRVHPSRSAVWSHLSWRPALAGRVRAVHLLDFTPAGPGQRPNSPPECVPAAAHPLLDEDCRAPSVQDLYLIAEAIEKMVELREFRWSTQRYPAKKSPAHWDAERAVWAAATRHAQLQHIGAFKQFWDSKMPIDIEYPFGALQHLRLQSIEFPKLRFMRNDGDNRPQPETQFNLLLRTSPWLQVLILRGSASGFKARLSNLFAHCQFKCLRELRLDISRTSANLEAYACLLEETPTLEVLEGNMGWGRALQPGSLPNLRRIAVYMGFYSTVEGVVTLFLDESLAPRRLEEFSCAVLTADVVDILRRGLHADTLRKLSVLFFESLSVLVDVVRLFPRLTWLSVPSREYMNDYHSATIKPIHLGQWGEVLVNLAELKTFYGVCLLRDPSSSWSTLNNDERAQELLEALPALRWTDHWDLKPEARRIALGRGSDGRATWKVEELLNYDGLDLRWAGDW